jgi:hypothetical protein
MLFIMCSQGCRIGLFTSIIHLLRIHLYMLCAYRLMALNHVLKFYRIYKHIILYIIHADALDQLSEAKPIWCRSHAQKYSN